MPKTSLAHRYIEAWNSHDPDKVLSFFKRNATYTDSGRHRQVQGSKVGHYVEKIITLCPDINFELLDGGITGSGRAALQWQAKGSDLRQLCPQLQLDHIESICGLDYITHEQGRLISCHVYIDLLPFTQPTTSKPSTRPREYQKSGLSPDDLQSYQQQLTTLMQQQNLYLQHDLTLAELANKMELSTNHLSQVINGAFGASFYEFLNNFRIEKAKSLLQIIPAQDKVSTLDIAFESGFGSVSAFYRAFQQQVGMTPVQYRKQSL